MSTEVANLPYSFRPYVPDDVNFIHSSWGSSYHDGVNGHHQLTPDEFHAYHRPIRDRVLSNPNSAAIVCHNKSDPDHIIGWILVEKPARGNYIKCHYVYVKSTFGGEGIATELMKMALPIRPVLYTHLTLKARRIMKENWKANKNTYERFHACHHLV